MLNNFGQQFTPTFIVNGVQRYGGKADIMICMIILYFVLQMVVHQSQLCSVIL